jgi:DNA-binding transcriptional LysR family regulator
MLNPTHLQSLRIVVQCGSLTKAATRLGYSPSAISQQMSALERATGTRLFIRTARTLRPTDAGLRLAERSVPLLLQLEALARDLPDGTGRRGRLHVGSSSAMNCSVMPRVLRRCRDQLPGVELIIDDGEPSYLIGQLVGEAALDLALLYRFEPSVYMWPRGFQVDQLAVDPLDLAVPVGHPAAGQPALTMSSLAAENWITHTVGVSGTLSFERACADAGFVPHVTARSDEFSVILALVAAGHGIAAVPRTASLPVDGVVYRELLEPRMNRTILALRRDVADAELVSDVLGLVTEELERLTGTPRW